MPFPGKINPLRRLPVLALAALTAIAGAACVSKPTMQLDHAEITGIRIAFPPSLGILMTIVVNVHNPNSYDVAVRAVRGQVVLAGRYPMPVDFRANGDGVWLPSDRTTQVRVPVSLPVDLGLQLVRETFTSPSSRTASAAARTSPPRAPSGSRPTITRSTTRRRLPQPNRDRPRHPAITPAAPGAAGRTLAAHCGPPRGRTHAAPGDHAQVSPWLTTCRSAIRATWRACPDVGARVAGRRRSTPSKQA